MVFWFKPKKPGLFGFFIKTMVFPNPEIHAEKHLEIRDFCFFTKLKVIYQLEK